MPRRLALLALLSACTSADPPPTPALSPALPASTPPAASSQPAASAPPSPAGGPPAAPASAASASASATPALSAQASGGRCLSRDTASTPSGVERCYPFRCRDGRCLKGRCLGRQDCAGSDGPADLAANGWPLDCIQGKCVPLPPGHVNRHRPAP